MVAMVANEGRIYRPFLVKEVRDPVNGTVITALPPRADPHLPDPPGDLPHRAGGDAPGGHRGHGQRGHHHQGGGGGRQDRHRARWGCKDRWHSWFAAYGPYQALNPDDQVVVVVMVEARNDWEWWAPKAADVIFQGIFAHQNFQEAVETLRPWWYIQQLQAERARLRAAGGAAAAAAAAPRRRAPRPQPVVTARRRPWPPRPGWTRPGARRSRARTAGRCPASARRRGSLPAAGPRPPCRPSRTSTFRRRCRPGRGLRRPPEAARPSSRRRSSRRRPRSRPGRRRPPSRPRPPLRPRPPPRRGSAGPPPGGEPQEDDP